MQPPPAEGKVVLLGATSVGKTAIVNRAVSDTFEQEQPSTIGGHYSTKTIAGPTGTAVLRIWDTAGQERYRSLAPMYYQGSQVAIIVFSLSDPSTLDAADGWANELKNHLDRLPHVYLVGNKSDLADDRKVDIYDAMDRASALNAVYMETSARSGQNIYELFKAIGDQIITDRLEQPAHLQAVAIERFTPPARGCKC
jgi:small GTP-binding protein